ncbi:MAG: matrixin family metalloprotease, partial [Planctomycetota bacterium]
LSPAPEGWDEAVPYEGMVAEVVTKEEWDQILPPHQRMIFNILQNGPVDVDPVTTCFQGGASDATIDGVYEALLRTYGPRYQQTARWSTTSAGNTGGQGDPIVLRYSYVPDGTFIPSGVGEPAGNSDLQAFLTGIYGNAATWQQIFDDIFDRWGSLCGITFIYEPNDDGVDMFSLGGQAGVRGDLRIGGKFIDGNSGTLAYNFFPNNGDMVIDTGDSFYFNTGNNSLALRNVLMHEHGHGMGQLHVCPLDLEKLMEPIFTSAFYGPQHDDIRNAHRHYGDPNEPDNNSSQATDLGVFGSGSSATIGTVPVVPGRATPPDSSILSIDANGEQDWFQVTVNSPLNLTTTVRPLGRTYTDDAQACGGAPASCCSTAVTNSLTIANLAIQVYDQDGLSLLATAQSNGAGSNETLTDVFLAAPGDYFIRVYETNNPSESQLYLLDVAFTPPPFIPVTLSLVDPVPTNLDPAADASFLVAIDPGDDTLSAAELFYRYDGGAYLSSPLAPQGGDQYLATLPASLTCDGSAEFYLQATGASSTAELPVGAPANTYSAIFGTIVVDSSFDFETSTGWTVDDDPSLTEGTWETGVPENNGRGDPPADFDGSGSCFLTENDPNDSNSDVDGGETRLVSPVFDITGLTEPTVSYARWFDNTAGDSPQQDVMTIEVSDDGGSSWQTLEIVGPTTGDANPEVTGGWVEKSFRIDQIGGISVTSQFRIRFGAEDADPGSVVEAGVDAFSITGRDCTFTPPTSCIGDVDGDGDTDLGDFTDLASNFGASGLPFGSGESRTLGDLDDDGDVDLGDFTILASDFGCSP